MVLQLLMALTQIVLLCAILLNAVLLLNMSAVHPSKAKQFALLCINTFQLAEFLVMGGIMLRLYPPCSSPLQGSDRVGPRAGGLE